MRKYDETGEVFRDENEYWGEGDWIIEGELGKRFEILREEGFNGFYKGEIGKELVNVVKGCGGTMSLE
ncbi:gamma-glutamyltransferase, partial [Staphylococcus aureus]|uniref:gamma-glutamyltransferase n=1 Tax=Staphylococcus aureus TaxID=1280 RepID=UPI0021B244C5